MSKANNQAWNSITQSNALVVSEKMYEDNDSVKSQLIDSYAWDTIVKWMADENVDVINSTNYGNYVNTKWDVNGLYAIHKFKYGSWQWTSVAVM